MYIIQEIEEGLLKTEFSNTLLNSLYLKSFKRIRINSLVLSEYCGCYIIYNIYIIYNAATTICSTQD